MYLKSRPLDWAFLVTFLLPLLLGFGCGKPSGPSTWSYKVSYNPYQLVDWNLDHRCLTQFHDHVIPSGGHPDGSYAYLLNCYDQAGYQAVSVLHYSGVPSHPEAWRKRFWPVSKLIESATNDSELLSRHENLRVFIPGAEEVGYHHMLSPFLTEYIEKWEAEKRTRKYPFHYESAQACIERIREYGGLAVIAHPWNRLEHYDQYSDFQAIEVYSGYSNHKFKTGETEEDANLQFLRVWDHLLETKSTQIWGIGVNDWFGPGREDLRGEYPTHIDSGKTVVLVKDWTLASLRESFEMGAMFAVKDLGIEKGEYPRIDTIEVSDREIRIEGEGDVEWIANQTVHATGEVFSLENLPTGMKYIRAQVRNATGEVFVQPFTLATR